MRIVLAGGGSGGHVYPALAIMDALVRLDPDLEVLYVGTSHGVEAQIVPSRQVRFEEIQAAGILGKSLWRKVTGAQQAVNGLWQARRILKRFQAEIVVGTGGYVTGPVGLAAVTLRIPLVIQEQNVWPGMTNRLLSRYARLVLTPYEASRQYLPHAAKIQLVSNPVGEPWKEDRDTARKALGLRGDLKVLMVTGGSQGAASINRWVLKAISSLASHEDYGLLWATGPRYFDGVQKEIQRQGSRLDSTRMQVHAYFDPIGRFYRASDLVLGRAGAMTIADGLAYGLPMILVPSPNVSEDHQTFNARQLETAGAAVMVNEKDLEEAGGLPVVRLLDDPEACRHMRDQATALHDGEAAVKMANMVREVYRQTRRERR